MLSRASYAFFRDSFAGRLLYNVSGHKYFKHPEELPDYVVPSRYLDAISSSENQSMESKEDVSDGSQDQERILVGWDSEDDPENPLNWPLHLKVIYLMQVGFLTISIYIGSSIYMPGIEELMADMHVGRVVAILPMSLFVVGYGLGPMFFGPMSEHPSIGRTYVYVLTLFAFFILQIPTALVRDIASLCILRFLAGFFASPSLSMGGASVGDIITPARIPVGLAGWSWCASCGPAFGPFLGGLFCQRVNVYWCFWFLVIISGFSCIVLTFCLPEASQVTLLYRKANRLRAITGNNRLVSEGHLRIESMTPRQVAVSTLWRPIEITIREPMVLATNIYLALVYSVIYLFFEAFPIVLGGIHHFTLIAQGVSYMAVAIGFVIGAILYVAIMHQMFTKPVKQGKTMEAEVFMPCAIFGGCFLPVGLFIFAWSSSYHTHWIGPLIGSGVFACGAFIIFQTMFNYLAFAFPRFMASAFASNSLFRASSAAAFPLFANIMYENLGPKEYPVGWGCTILAIAGVVMIGIPVSLYFFGERFRGNSRYAN